MIIIDIIKNIKRAFVFGIGGGGDIVSTIPVANFLKKFNVDVFYGSILWDRLVVDPKPGPRSLDELLNLERVEETLAFVNENTRTVDGIVPNVARASKVLKKVVALDITKGSRKLAKDISSFMEKEKIEIALGVDAGGDAIATCYESGVKSPLADALSVATLKELNGVVAIFGFGSDGELKSEELLMNISELIKRRGLLGCVGMSYEDYEEMKKLANSVVTEASFLPLLAFEGFFGFKKLRRGRTTFISPISILTFYFKASSVFEINEAAKIVSEAKDIEEANSLLHKAGILTELDLERALSGFI
ncbi:MAG: DUF1152 domain-containing protein [Archaeoglobaceae archaeon]|nr:DUF1152 domain-containing protein [Archaeoglobaceae archaeon]MCX8151838.1 DUF1152 domain-containing protein [Archaeoglobaceae archaeon]MDW8014330.1 DUF1152 domain-containing protein [Archaeoglobaceae archaeon]